VLPRNVTGAIAGAVVPMIGWANFFMVTCLSAVPGLIVLVFLREPLNELAAREAASAKH
jgi:MFS transporter, PAT family, beta-lactamase induction signal transducer AmpG